MNFFRRFLCLCLAGLGLAWPVTAQEILEGNPEKALSFRCLTYRDTAGHLLRVREFSYELDTLTGEAVVRERISDSSGTKAIIVNSYEGSRLAQKEEYDSDGQLLKRTRYQFVTFAEEAYPSLMTIETFQPDFCVNGSQINYSDTAGYHFPLEITSWTSGKPADRVRYTYPFCPPDHYGPMADSLLAHGMPGAILSVTHWRDSVDRRGLWPFSGVRHQLSPPRRPAIRRRQRHAGHLRPLSGLRFPGVAAFADTRPPGHGIPVHGSATIPMDGPRSGNGAHAYPARL